ncbi:glutathione S-transferase 1-like [Centruroides vittatus]|uniref:glutathione S-transferase 1-like n=1 Tax=Centruroides sculpturatus TaxID=218467 RepID=UPI000C6DF390|nr:glutathione S-transferase 1-like [Centruroides sculpturatus]
MTIDIYYAPVSGPCRAAMMTAKHIGLELNVKKINLMAGETRKPEYLAMNPQHCVPTIDDNGFILWESRAVMTYFVNKYAPESDLYPKDPQKRALVDKMLYFDIGLLYKTLAETLFGPLFRGEKLNPDKEKAFRDALTLYDGYLQKTPYAAGSHITLADLSLLASLSFTILADYDISDFPHVKAWYEKVKDELPYYKEVNEEPMNAFKAILEQKRAKK